MKLKRNPTRGLMIVYILTMGLVMLNQHWFLQKGFDLNVFASANSILFMISILTLLITKRSLNSENPNAFVRAMYGSFMIKFFAIAIIAFAYILTVKKEVNKPALVSAAILYILYAVVEVKALMRELKSAKDA
jgi:hypothetical protein